MLAGEGCKSVEDFLPLPSVSGLEVLVDPLVDSGREGCNSVLFFLGPVDGLDKDGVGDGDKRRMTGAIERWRSVTPSLFSLLSIALP